MLNFVEQAMQPTSQWIVLVALGVAALCAIRLTQAVNRARKERATEAVLVSQKRCQPPARLKYQWPLGVDLLVEAFKADRADRILDFFIFVVEATATTFEQVILGARGVNTIDPENIEAILHTQFSEFSLGARSDNFRSLLGHGIFTQDGAAWKTSRELLRPQFMQTRSKSFRYIQEEIERFISALEITTSTSRIDLQPRFFRLTLDTTMAILFGKPLRDFTTEGIDETDFAAAFDRAQRQLARRGRLGDFYWLLGGGEFKSSCRKVHKFVDDVVTRAIKEDESRSSSSTTPQRYVFLDALISMTQDPVVLRDQCINVLLAGRDTTACLLSWTVILLATHQEVQKELRDECMKLASFAGGDLPTPAEIKEMHFLSFVLKEVLRLYPSVPINSRSALKATTLPTGGGPDGKSPLLVKKGEAVGYAVYVMHRRKDLYGEDADLFRPSRWSATSKKGPDLKNIGWGYLPFNGGPRICPGQEFALLEASYTIVRLLQTFQRIEKHSSVQAGHKHLVTLVVSSADGCEVDLIQQH